MTYQDVKDKLRREGRPEDFLRALEWAEVDGIRFVGLHIFYPIRVTRRDFANAERFATITLAELSRYGCATQGHFTGVTVKIVDSSKGKIDQHEFLFDDLLTDKDRKKPRDPQNCFDSGFQVVASCGWRWYIAEPKSTRRFCEAVEEYIRRFQ